MTNTRGIPSAGTGQAAPGTAPRRLRIIVADDEQDTVLTLMMLLREEGHDVWGLYRAKDLLRYIKDHEADVVVLDIGMPDLSGFEAARQIHERFGTRKPLLIAITGKYKQGSDRILSEIVGFDHYLVKPFDPAELLKLLAPLRTSIGDDTQ